MAEIDYKILEQGNLQVILKGRFDAENTAPLWRSAVNKVEKTRPDELIVDAAGVEYCDATGIGLLLELKRKQQSRRGKIQIRGLKPQFEQLMALFDPGDLPKPQRRPMAFVRVAEDIGRALVGLWHGLRGTISFAGELFCKLLHTLVHPGGLRWKDTFRIAEKSGADAVGITALLGFLIGLILAFQSAMAMKKFGAQVFVADLVVLSLFRELGPLLTAFVLAARSGSAFAAEIGTMKVNEEIDALTTMGLDPVRFLAVPRIIAVVFITPLLALFHMLAGLIGCGLVMVSLGFTPITYINRIQEAASLTDLCGGLAKTLVFGAMIAGIGCLRGLQTKSGASAVGDSATSAVVTSIVAIVVVDGVFAVVYYFLGI